MEFFRAPSVTFKWVSAISFNTHYDYRSRNRFMTEKASVNPHTVVYAVGA